VADTKVLAVADGVGGWINQGIDSGLFSKALVWDIHRLHAENNSRELKNILVSAVKANKNTGSSTAVLAKFDTTRHDILKTTNLGDSGYVLYRPNNDGNL
jgi:protein phosphatase PTC7